MTVLVEAGKKSGPLITARLALEQGRDVYAVPGPLIGGRHRLIRSRATLVTCVAEVAEELGWPLARSANATELARD